MSGAPAPALSVVVPVYNEAGNVRPLCEEIRDVLTALDRRFEIIFVNDGSSDATLAQLLQVAAVEPRLRVLDLDGNFGEAAALCAGFHAARGELVATLDGDGQNDPRDIPRLLECLERAGCRVVSGWRRERREGILLRVWPSRLANRLIAAVTRVPTHDNGCGLKVYERAVVQGAALPKGMNRFLPAIVGVRAAEVGEIPVSDRRRRHGQSHYGIGRTIVVLRDVLALPFLIRSPRRAEKLWAAGALVAGAAGIAGLLQSTAVAWLFGVATVLALLIWWNLRRFNRAQQTGVYRVRREYGPREETLR